jgi:pre-rRNA-processing protein TSR3
MKEFSWGHEFLRLNHELLELYRTATDAQDVISRQNEWLASAQERTDDSQTPASKLSRRKKKHWQEDSEEEEEDEYQEDNERGDDPPQLAMTHGVTGELPPSDDEYYEEYDSDDEPELDKFGNIVEKSKGNDDDDDDDDDDDKTDDANQSDLLNAIENVHVI